eukprot:jgi/Botrbrau1/12821/Bobra.20_1s0012.1
MEPTSSSGSSSLEIPESWHCVPPHARQEGMAGERTGISWTGGKDSFLAFQKATALGLEARVLMTFSPPGKTFYAHDKALLAEQALWLGVPHVFLDVPPEGDIKAGYLEGLQLLRDEWGVQTVVSGDMDLVGQMQGNWMRERCETAGLHMLCPLWKRDRLSCLQELLHLGIRAVITCAKSGCLDASWVGAEITEAMLPRLQSLHDEKGLDMCGENGEYHTMVLAAKGVRGCLCLRNCRVVELLPPSWQSSERCWYLHIGSVVRADTATSLVHFAP